MSATVGAALAWWARNRPTAAAFVFDDETLDYATVESWSSRIAEHLRSEGVRGGTRLLVLLGNQVELWETTLAAMKIGAVIIPATTLLAEADLRDRIDRGDVGAVIARLEIAQRSTSVAMVMPASAAIGRSASIVSNSRACQ